jgi:hypothetical protein
MTPTVLAYRESAHRIANDWPAKFLPASDAGIVRVLSSFPPRDRSDRRPSRFTGVASGSGGGDQRFKGRQFASGRQDLLREQAHAFRGLIMGHRLVLDL